jgi:hypothetical protein
MSELHVDYGEIIKIYEFRIACIDNDTEGVIYEDGVAYPVDRNGRFKDNIFPKGFDTIDNLLGILLHKQFEKRKK